MFIINNLSNNYNQKVIIGYGNDNIHFNFYFSDAQLSWFYSLTYGNFEIKNQRLSCHPNLLNKYRNIIPFGLRCLSIDGLDPYKIDDFVSGRVEVSILTSEDVEYVTNNELRRES